MLRSFMIITKQSGIVLYRKVFLKSIDKPIITAGLIIALHKWSAQTIGLPISYVELSNFSCTMAKACVPNTTESLICAAFHDTNDGEQYGRLLATELLQSFIKQNSTRLVQSYLRVTEGAQQFFKGFNSHVRGAVENAVISLMVHLEEQAEIKHVMLLRHKREVLPNHIGNVWHSSCRENESKISADLRNLLNVADDLLTSRKDVTAVVTIGARTRVERLSLATLFVVLRDGFDVKGCSSLIAEYSSVLQKLFVLIDGLQGL